MVIRLYSTNTTVFSTLYNNLKGWIRHIERTDTVIKFDVEVDMSLTEFAAMNAGFSLFECDVLGHSLIHFAVDRFVDDDGREK